MESASPNREIAVVGSGAVGCYYGAKLARAGLPVSFLMRRDLAHVRRHGLRVLSPEGDFALPRVECHGSTEEIGPKDLVLVAVKSTDNECLPRLLAPLLKADTVILTLQNGLGNEEFLASYFGPERIMGGLCFVCLNRIAPGVVEHYSAGAVTIGEFGRPPSARALDIAAAFRRGGIDCTVAKSLVEARWRKLVWNIPFNGLAIAAGGLDVSGILADPDLRALARDLMAEVIGAANALGCRLEESLVQNQIDKTERMGPYKPSSLLDYLNGAPVEARALWEEPLRQGQAVGCPMPRLETVFRLIQSRVRDRQAYHERRSSGGEAGPGGR